MFDKINNSEKMSSVFVNNAKIIVHALNINIEMLAV